jgi:ABC-type glucose/galactose transport system permease subunit
MSGQFVEIGNIRVDISQFDLSDTSSKVADVRTANIILISLVVVVVSLRLFARTKFVKRIFADDGKKHTTSGGTHILICRQS